MPTHNDLPEQNHDWIRSVYGEVTEEIPDNAPEPLGKEVMISTYLDANLAHCMATGRVETAVLHFVNMTPIEWYSKRQATMETATYGSEFVAAKTTVEQIMDLCHTLRYMGVPIKQKTYMFGDNQSLITSSTLPHSMLNKRHNILAYHRVHKAIAAVILDFYWIDSKANKSDILSKHWDIASVHNTIKLLFDFQGPIEWNHKVDHLK
ncbi:hypothetical protein ACA910_011122 [Epithemia clementina (nom. ined.)]